MSVTALDLRMYALPLSHRETITKTGNRFDELVFLPDRHRAVVLTGRSEFRSYMPFRFLPLKQEMEAGVFLGTVAAPTKYYTAEGTNVYFKMTKDGEPVNPLDYLG